MDSQPSLASSETASLPASRKKIILFACVCLILVVAFSGRFLLMQRANDTEVDPTPAPRPRLNAPFITSADAVVDKMIEIASVTKDDVVYDLGCGDGRIIVTAALTSGCQGVGFDIDPKRVAEARKNVELHDVGQLVSIKEQDIFKLDLSKADVAVMYLLPWMMQKLPPQFEQMKSGSRIVSHDFYIEGVEPERVAQVFVGENESRHFVYFYTVPLRWNPEMPKRPPTEGIADREDAKRAAAQKNSQTKPAASASQASPPQ